MLDSLIKIDRRLGYLDRALPTKSRQATTPINPAETRYDPGLYIRRHLGWRPWRGTPGHPGQQEVLDAYTLALRQMHERELYEQGKVRAEDLRHWAPGRVIKNRIRIEAGHTVGKTKLAAGLVNHFIDHFWPAVAYTFAPTWEQIKSLLWKEIKSDRRGKGLPGRILDTCEIQISDNHFAKGKSTSDDHGRGTERIQGQHERYLLLVMDEAEGVADFVFDAIDSMESGGIVVVIMLANPRTRTSRFHKAAANSDTRSFRISCLHHPNVVAGREVVPGTVRRQYVEKMIEKHCRVAPRHNPDDHTFELPFEVRLEGRVLPAGTIFLPDSEFMFRVMGEAPANTSDKSLVPTGRYDAAARRPAPREASHAARIGVDVAGFGNDKGTIYVRHGDLCWRAHQLSKLDQVEYYQHVKAECFKLARKGVTSLRARIDAGGGFGGGVAALLKKDVDLRQSFRDFDVHEVDFNGSPRDPKAFADKITELTAAAAEVLHVLSLERPPEELRIDLTEREYDWVIKGGRSVKKLEDKKRFRDRQHPHRSPDDGDGFVLAVAPDHVVERPATKKSNYMDR